jgi:alpha-glucoside transport system substrate-binding protein
MASLRYPRAAPSVATALVAAVLLGACAGSAAQSQTADPACAAYAHYEGHRGTTVTVFSSIRDVEADRLSKAWESFQACTGITIDYTGSADFETVLPQQVKRGEIPDLAFLPQPGLLASLVRQGAVKPAGPAVAANVGRYYSADWRRYGTVDGTLYAAPIDANVKSLVWYSPKYFAEKGYTVPRTWADMLALSDRIAAGGVKPWCAGIESGGATGWPATVCVYDRVQPRPAT